MFFTAVVRHVEEKK